MRIFAAALAVSFVSLAVAQNSLAGPKVAARSAVVMDAVTGKVLWGRNIDTPRFPASTTKVMTTLLTLENASPDQMLTAPALPMNVGGSSLHMKPSEQISMRDAVYAMMLRSANDVCHAVALQLAGSEKAFAEMMNQRAIEIGATRTRFTNPHGLPDRNHITTARDLALIAREAMRNGLFREVARTQRHWVERSINQQDRLLINRNKWLFKDSTADGIKTGFTRDSGHTYIGSAVRNGFRVITVVLNSETWQEDHGAMLDWAFGHFAVGLAVKPGQELGTLPVSGGREDVVRVAASVPVQLLERKAATTRFELDWPGERLPSAPISAGQKLGEALVKDADGYTLRVPITALETVPQKPRANFGDFGTLAWYILGGAMLTGAWVMRRKSRTA